MKIPSYCGCNIAEYDSYNWTRQNQLNANLIFKNLQNAQNAQNTFSTFCWWTTPWRSSHPKSHYHFFGHGAYKGNLQDSEDSLIYGLLSPIPQSGVAGHLDKAILHTTRTTIAQIPLAADRRHYQLNNPFHLPCGQAVKNGSGMWLQWYHRCDDVSSIICVPSIDVSTSANHSTWEMSWQLVRVPMESTEDGSNTDLDTLGPTAVNETVEALVIWIGECSWQLGATVVVTTSEDPSEIKTINPSNGLACRVVCSLLSAMSYPPSCNVCNCLAESWFKVAVQAGLGSYLGKLLDLQFHGFLSPSSSHIPNPKSKILAIAQILDPVPMIEVILTCDIMTTWM